MNDVLDRLAALRPDSFAPADAASDISRGRRALARRRTVRGAGVGVLALAAAGVAVVSGSPRGEHTGLDLVAYDGRQLPGFTVAKVPEGFVLQGANANVLAVAPAESTTTIDDFEGKLVVSLESAQPAPPAAPTGGTVVRDGDFIRVRCENGKTFVLKAKPGQDVVDSRVCATAAPSEPAPVEGFDVDGSKLTLSTNSEGARYVRYEHGDQTVVVQMWPGLGLTDAELREFADGITVTDAAQVSHG